MPHRLLLAASVAALGVVSAPSCDDPLPVAPGGQIALSVAPLDYPGVTNAAYTLTVKNKSGQTVFTRSLDSRAYGDGTGALSYVGPCDAEPSENPNTVSLTLTGLFAGATGATTIDPSTYHNPGELTRSATCTENADTPVTFDITLARAAQQGFFDVAVTFENIFCSAKLDCVDQDGQTLALLHTASGARGRSVVLGLACTGDLSPSGETYLYRTPIVVTCTGGTATVDPSAGPGNLAAGTGYTTTGTSPLFAAAVYRGEEQLSFNKRYWNVVLGLADTAQSCTVSTRATASPDPLVGGNTPSGTTWPYIVWSRALTDASSARACTRHPVDGAAPNDGVATVYTAADVPQAFPFAFGPTIVPTLCAAGQTTCNLTSCKAIVDAGLATGSGTYAIDPDGPSTGAAALDVWCAMPSGTTLRLGASANASWTSISAGCPAGWVPYAVDRFERVAIAQAFAAAHTSDWYWLNFFAGPDTNVSGALENQLGWISSTSPLTWTSSGFADAGATALPNLDISGNQNQGFHDPIALSRTIGFANRGGTNYIYNSAEQTLMAPVVCALPQPAQGGLTLADPGRLADGSVAATCEDYRRPILPFDSAVTSGVYSIDPDGAATGAASFSAWCDQTTNDGGWTLLITFQTSATPFASPAAWPSTFATVGTAPNATGMYKGSLAAFGEVREEVNSGAQVVWARDLDEAELNAIRELYGYTSRLAAAATYAGLPACRTTYAAATDNVAGCVPAAYVNSGLNDTVTGFQVDLFGQTHCWFARGGGVWSTHRGSGRCVSTQDPDGTRWARTWFR